jgi:DNA-directed RNA polymerase specialized sigma subunit
MSTQTYTVRAVRWAGGWELHIDDVGVTQTRTLATAENQVRDYLDSLLGIDSSDIDVVVVPDLGGLESTAHQIRTELDEAAAAQIRAAEHSRQLVRALRDDGLSVTDIAAVLGITRGRVSQLLKPTPAGPPDAAPIKNSG